MPPDGFWGQMEAQLMRKWAGWHSQEELLALLVWGRDDLRSFSHANAGSIHGSLVYTDLEMCVKAACSCTWRANNFVLTCAWPTYFDLGPVSLEISSVKEDGNLPVGHTDTFHWCTYYSSGDFRVSSQAAITLHFSCIPHEGYGARWRGEPRGICHLLSWGNKWSKWSDFGCTSWQCCSSFWAKSRSVAWVQLCVMLMYILK